MGRVGALDGLVDEPCLSQLHSGSGALEIDS